jgi:small subunit ribosomal protein S20
MTRLAASNTRTCQMRLSACHLAQPWAESRLFFPPLRESASVANIKSAEKRARQTIKRKAHNAASRSRLRTAIKSVNAAVDAGNKEAAVATLKAAVPVIDTMVNKGIIHRNKAARHKSQLNARVKEL